MNWAIVAAVASLFSIIGTVGSVFYFAGRFTQRIEDHDKQLVEHSEQLEEHDDKIGTHAVEIAKLNAWRDGYNAATRASHETQS